MGYYKNKILAYRMIDRLVSEGNSNENIIFKVQTAYGFNENMIIQRIELLHSLVEKKGEE